MRAAKIIPWSRPPAAVLVGAVAMQDAVVCADADCSLIYSTRLHPACPSCGSRQAVLASRALEREATCPDSDEAGRG